MVADNDYNLMALLGELTARWAAAGGLIKMGDACCVLSFQVHDDGRSLADVLGDPAPEPPAPGPLPPLLVKILRALGALLRAFGLLDSEQAGEVA